MRNRSNRGGVSSGVPISISELVKLTFVSVSFCFHLNILIEGEVIEGVSMDDLTWGVYMKDMT